MSSVLGRETSESITALADGGELERRCIERRSGDRRRAPPSASDTAWRSGAELLGYALWASDGVVGRITDLCFEEESLTVTGIFALARRFFLSQRLFVPLGAVVRIDPSQRRVEVRLTRAQIRELSSRRDSEN